MEEIPEQQALSDQSQRLSQVTSSPERETCGCPTEGAMLCEYSEAPVFFPAFNMWRAHPAVDFEARDGELVCAMLAGTVIFCNDGCVRIDHGNGLESQYRGIKKISATLGQRVRKGAVIGLAGGRVPYEGEGRICVSLLENGKAIPFSLKENEK